MIRFEFRSFLIATASLLMLAPAAIGAETDKPEKTDNKGAAPQTRQDKPAKKKSAQKKPAEAAPVTAAPAPQGAAKSSSKTRALKAPPSAAAPAPGNSSDGGRTGDPLGGLPGAQQTTGEKTP